MEQSKSILKGKSFVEQNEARAKQNEARAKSGAFLLKLTGTVVLLGMILTLSATNNFLFFNELLYSSGIIMLLSIMRFVDTRKA